MSGARGIITAFARILVSEPCQPLGSSILHAGLGCRSSVPGVSGNSPDLHPPLARRRASDQAILTIRSVFADEEPPVESVGRCVPAVLVMVHDQGFGRRDQRSKQRSDHHGATVEEVNAGNTWVL